MKKYFLLSSMLTQLVYAENKIESVISSQNIHTIAPEIKLFDSEPRYGAYISSKNCSVEVLINDIPVMKYSDDSGNGLAGSYFQLNEGILKKGNQKITIKMTPGFNKDQKALDSILSPDSEMQIKIVKSMKNQTGNAEESEVRKYSTAKKKRVNDHVFEDTFTFMADIPYYIQTLENAEVLQTADQDKMQALEQAVAAKYNELRNIYMKGSWSALASLYYNREKRIAKQLYLLPDEIKNRWNNEYVFRTNSDITFFDLKPIEDYKITFYAEGKIVCLEKVNNGKSALWGSFKRKGKDDVITTYIPLYLYRPKGTNSLELY